MLEGLTFENGKLVKFRHMRPEYMDGHDLIALARLLGAEVYRLHERDERMEYHLREIDGCLAEYEALPCKSLRARLRAAVNRAKLENANA
jgi:hypothetical protein